MSSMALGRRRISLARFDAHIVMPGKTFLKYAAAPQ
jgi:hypothetical protein